MNCLGVGVDPGFLMNLDLALALIRALLVAGQASSIGTSPTLRKEDQRCLPTAVAVRPAVAMAGFASGVRKGRAFRMLSESMGIRSECLDPVGMTIFASSRQELGWDCLLIARCRRGRRLRRRLLRGCR